MNPQRSGRWMTLLLLGVWLLVVGWQAEEHHRVVEAARTDLRNRAGDIANTVSALIRAAGFRDIILQNRLEPVLKLLVTGRTNAIVKASDLIYVTLLNINGDPVAWAGNTNLFSRELLAGNDGANGFWSTNYVTFVLPVEGASLTNNPVVLPGPPADFTNGPSRGGREFLRREPRGDDFESTNGAETVSTNVSSPVNGQMMPPPGDGNRPPEEGGRPRGGRGRPPWLRQMPEADFKALIASHELHGLVLAVSTDAYRAVCIHDLWLRLIISFFAGISALGAGLAWRNTGRTADLQIRLVRASELNSHLKELNLAAAGLAHETRNPLNIIRGQAQMISRLPDAAPEVREKSKIIVDETDKVTAQLTEFINYSRPREVRRTRVALAEAGNEIIRTLGHDIEEKKLRVEVGGDPLAVQADEQLLRQVLFNLLINAIQAVAENGRIQIVVQRDGPGEAALEVRDDGSGVPAENRREIFKPYFTTHQKGTGLGLAVVQQIILAHGWEIACLPNEPRGAVFRITHLKIAA